ncbi:MAG: ABC transporter ATP-binding protein [Erysipelotrichaceae bacterium]|nr:ABC transporter ATP-binding protein [Erysipelotrichaceae bacterium]
MKQNKITVLLRMLKLVKPLRWFMALAVVLGTLGFLAAQMIPVFGVWGILAVLGEGAPFALKTIMIFLPVLAAVRSVCRFSEQRTNHYIAFTLLAIVRDRVFQALRRLCPAKLEGRDSGDLVSLITSDVELMEVFYAHTISPICIALVTETIMVLFISHYHPLQGLLALCAYLCIGILLPAWISKRSGTLGDDLRRKSGELASHMLESIRGIDTTLQYHDGEHRLKEISDRTLQLSEDQGELNRLSGTNAALANTLILIFNLLMLVLSVHLYRNGYVTFEGFLIPLAALMSSYGPVSALAALGTTLQNTTAAGSRVLALVDEEPETEEISGYPEVIWNGASAEHVTFSYGSETVLRDVSLEIPVHGITGISGKSGSGKSTLLKLLMRFWKTKAGNIKISDTEIEKINTGNLRNMEGYMTQETVLFKDTIANNVRIGKLDASQEEVEDACRRASLHEFIASLPQGYETVIGEGTVTLSGGEKQRLGLARAFLHDAGLILLDEPTSNLDSLNEAIVLKALYQEKEKKSIVIVSHRQSTMRIADTVYSMDQGRIS